MAMSHALISRSWFACILIVLLEMYFTLPRELTGRGAEHVRCTARVVHVDEHADETGERGIGAAVERFEFVAQFTFWIGRFGGLEGIGRFLADVGNGAVRADDDG